MYLPILSYLDLFGYDICIMLCIPRIHVLLPWIESMPRCQKRLCCAIIPETTRGPPTGIDGISINPVNPSIRQSGGHQSSRSEAVNPSIRQSVNPRVVNLTAQRPSICQSVNPSTQWRQFVNPAKTSPGVEKTHIAKLITKMKEWPKEFRDLFFNH